MFKLLRHRRSRIETSKQKLVDLHRSAEEIDAQWPEVIRLADWARETREQNHLTDLFLHGRRAR